MNRPIIPFGKYYLLDRINVGGMAEVFRAKAFGVEGFERLVAVKRILPSVAEDTAFITMFIDEAKIAVQLSHANIAQIFDLGKVGDAYFIALEYVHGKDLRAVLGLSIERGVEIPIALCCYVVQKVCEGLDYAHNKRDASGRSLELVHRDVSPQNVLVSFDGEVKLIDFGIAKAIGKAGRTEAGVLKGKFGYLSPEQVQGGSVDRRSDIFAVGIVLHELLTGERLFAGDTEFSAVEKVRDAAVPMPSSLRPGVSQELDAIVLKALAVDPDERYQSALELHDALQQFLYRSGQTFDRRDLSAWLREQFPEDAVLDHEALELDDLPPEATKVSPILEAEEPEVLDAPPALANGGGAGRNGKSTMLGMGALVEAPLRRSVPPPPPPSSASPSGVVGHSMPPPKLPTIPPPPEGSSIPSVKSPSSPPRATGRTVPPPPPRTLPPPVPPSDAVQLGEPPARAGATPPTPSPAEGPALDMDWDDEDLSTQIYDRPEGSLGTSGSFHPLEDEPEGRVPTYVPPSGRAAVASGRGLPTENSPSLTVSSSLLGAAHPSATQPIATQTSAAPRESRTLYAALGVAVFAALMFFAYLTLMPAEPGVVQLTTHPIDPTVLFDGEPVGSVSPFVRTGVTPGEKHVVEVRKEGYIPWMQEVQVQPGQRLDFPITLQPEGGGVGGTVVAGVEATGGFSLESDPPGAKVFLNGEELGGLTPLRVANLVPRVYDVTLKAPGYRDYATRVEVRSGIDQSLPRAVMVPQRVQVRIGSTPSGAAVAVVRGDERKELGSTPLSVSLESEDDEPWTVELTLDGYRPYSKALIATGTEPIRIEAQLESVSAQRRVSRPSKRARTNAPRRSSPAASAEKGTLRINSRPWSQVYVDGQLIGNTPQMSISLSEGEHRVVLVNPEFGLKKALSVAIVGGRVTTKIVSLQ